MELQMTGAFCGPEPDQHKNTLCGGVGSGQVNTKLMPFSHNRGEMRLVSSSPSADNATATAGARCHASEGDPSVLGLEVLELFVS